MREITVATVQMKPELGEMEDAPNELGDLEVKIEKA